MTVPFRYSRMDWEALETWHSLDKTAVVVVSKRTGRDGVMHYPSLARIRCGCGPKVANQSCTVFGLGFIVDCNSSHLYAVKNNNLALWDW